MTERAGQRFDGEAVAKALGTNAQDVTDPAYGQGQHFQVQSDSTFLSLDTFPESGVSRITTKGARIELFGGMLPRVEDEGIVFLQKDSDHEHSTVSLSPDGLVNMRRQTGAGKRVERVRLIDDPPTTYQRCGLTGVPAALEAGEDVRYLRRAKAEEAALPAEDFWLFDSRYVALFHYEGDEPVGLELIEDPAHVLRYCQVRDAAWHYAIPYREFVAQVPSAV
ncbi:DUF6879 family protein [Streptomyces sp. NBC_01006]|uniref:DUF6879 family protein n=1 Tax=Streptomyces sp. NBC_01006 TaxID=2903716 RepID=UPI0038664668|nr:hypothetical protein OG509_30775 [Streptomyces sp. NBC_01006]